MRFSTVFESPKMKGLRLYESGRVKIKDESDFETLFSISGTYGKDTDVSFIKEDYKFKCFNDECSLWRAGEAGDQICYHIHAARIFIVEQSKKSPSILHSKDQNRKYERVSK